MVAINLSGLQRLEGLLIKTCEQIDVKKVRISTDVIPTGWSDLDDYIGGLRRGEVLLVASAPQLGKTAFGLNLVHHTTVSLGLETLIFAPGSSSNELTLRLMAADTRISLDSLRSGDLNEGDWSRVSMALGKLNVAPISIATGSDYCPSRIAVEATKAKSPSLLMIDNPERLLSGMDKEKAPETLRSLKALAKWLNVAVVVLITLPTKLERRSNPRPQFSDLEAIGIHRSMADSILFLYRDEVYRMDSMDKGIAEVLVASQQIGQTGRCVRLCFLNEFMRFETIVHGVQNAT